MVIFFITCTVYCFYNILLKLKKAQNEHRKKIKKKKSISRHQSKKAMYYSVCVYSVNTTTLKLYQESI